MVLTHVQVHAIVRVAIRTPFHVNCELMKGSSKAHVKCTEKRPAEATDLNSLSQAAPTTSDMCSASKQAEHKE